MPADHVVADAQRLPLVETHVDLGVALMLVSRRLDDRHRRVGGRDRHLAALATALVAAKEEHLVPHDRTARRAAELLPVIWRLHLLAVAARRRRRRRVQIA